jgi:hypothetical protein
MYAEGANMIGSDLSTHVMPVNNIGYVVNHTAAGGTGSVAAAGNFLLNGLAVDPAAIKALNNTATNEIVSSIPVITPGLGGAGDIAQNKFSIQWELATPAVVGLAGSSGTLLSQNLNPDRYVTSVFLALKAHD